MACNDYNRFIYAQTFRQSNISKTYDYDTTHLFNVECDVLQVVNDKAIRPEVDGINPNLPINSIRISRSHCKSFPTTNATTTRLYYLSFADKNHTLLQKLGLENASCINAAPKDSNKEVKGLRGYLKYQNEYTDGVNEGRVSYLAMLILRVSVYLLKNSVCLR